MGNSEIIGNIWSSAKVVTLNLSPPLVGTSAPFGVLNNPDLIGEIENFTNGVGGQFSEKNDAFKTKFHDLIGRLNAYVIEKCSKDGESCDLNYVLTHESFALFLEKSSSVKDLILFGDSVNLYRPMCGDSLTVEKIKSDLKVTLDGVRSVLNSSGENVLEITKTAGVSEVRLTPKEDLGAFMLGDILPSGLTSLTLAFQSGFYRDKSGQEILLEIKNNENISLSMRDWLQRRIDDKGVGYLNSIEVSSSDWIAFKSMNETKIDIFNRELANLLIAESNKPDFDRNARNEFELKRLNVKEWDLKSADENDSNK